MSGDDDDDEVHVEIGDGARGSADEGGPPASGPGDAGSGRAAGPCPGAGGAAAAAAPAEPDASSSSGGGAGAGAGRGEDGDAAEGAPAADAAGSADAADAAGSADAAEGAPAADAAEGAPAADAAEGAPAADAADLHSRLLAAEERAGELEAQLRRALADYRNLERRARDGVDAAVRDRVARFAADMVSVRDDFERAARVAAPGHAAGGAADGEAVSSGLRAVLQGMDSALSKHGVAPIEAIGEIFDPLRHEAVATAEDAALDEGTITSEVARGYSLDERIIRPSRVVISKKPATEEVGA